MKIQVEVTDEDINEGICGNCKYCPVALAIARVTNANYLLVGTRTVAVDKLTGILPLNAYAFIKDFDSELPVEPITFELILS